MCSCVDVEMCRFGKCRCVDVEMCRCGVVEM